MATLDKWEEKEENS